jgi:small-conductance mechanosensitive channel
MRAPTHSTISLAGARRITQRTHLRRALTCGLLFLVTTMAIPWVGGIHAPSLPMQLTAIGLAIASAGLGITAVRSLAGEVAQLVAVRGGQSTAGALRLLLTITGYILVLVSVLAVVAIPVKQLLVSGAITGVVIGIAAQQSLSNTFAGLTLLAARPFAVGDYITLRAGALGGQFDGTVMAIGLAFTTLHTDEGPINVPNSAVLGAASGTRPHPENPRDPAEDRPAEDALAAPRLKPALTADGTSKATFRSSTSAERTESELLTPLTPRSPTR